LSLTELLKPPKLRKLTFLLARLLACLQASFGIRPKAIHGDVKFTSMVAVLVAWLGLRAAETKLLIAMPQGEELRLFLS